MSLQTAQKVIVPQKKIDVPHFLKQRDINSYFNAHRRCNRKSTKIFGHWEIFLTKPVRTVSNVLKTLNKFLLLSWWCPLGHGKGHLPTRQFIKMDRLVPVSTHLFSLDSTLIKCFRSSIAYGCVGIIFDITHSFYGVNVCNKECADTKAYLLIINYLVWYSKPSTVLAGVAMSRGTAKGTHNRKKPT